MRETEWENIEIKYSPSVDCQMSGLDADMEGLKGREVPPKKEAVFT